MFVVCSGEQSIDENMDCSVFRVAFDTSLSSISRTTRFTWSSCFSAVTSVIFPALSRPKTHVPDTSDGLPLTGVLVGLPMAFRRFSSAFAPFFVPLNAFDFLRYPFPHLIR